MKGGFVSMLLERSKPLSGHEQHTPTETSKQWNHSIIIKKIPSPYSSPILHLTIRFSHD